MLDYKLLWLYESEKIHLNKRYNPLLCNFGSVYQLWIHKLIIFLFSVSGYHEKNQFTYYISYFPFYLFREPYKSKIVGCIPNRVKSLSQSETGLKIYIYVFLSHSVLSCCCLQAQAWIPASWKYLSLFVGRIAVRVVKGILGMEVLIKNHISRRFHISIFNHNGYCIYTSDIPQYHIRSIDVCCCLPYF